ncbi:glycosyltransferase family 2 protein [Leptolyngbya ohadii]|uniref:glycosyltransferase family 2 protein n=1 Tax=Leptolyngbya ohadii TaxID=1962290 RepID=UPI000B59F348|nr:glycosyltransferase [Leptolyngbya ohadii]
MAICRVYLTTYRRHRTLRRAVESLLNQTVTDWVCELHNDDPTDHFPRQLAEEIGDPRIQVIDHAENLGATRSFNLIFQPVAEEFISLLEDDNWWEPHFLETMIGTMRQFPDVQVSWANMRHWQETAEGNWIDTEKTTWNFPPTAAPQPFFWGHPRQLFSALHSNGAMLVRSQSARRYTIPDRTPFEGAEAVRERTFHFPILLVPQVCANFAITRQSSRSKDGIVWAQIQTLLAASFLKHVPLIPAELQQIWQQARSKTPKSTATLFFTAIACPFCRRILQFATLSDWLFFLAYCLKHPIATWRISQSIATYPELWQFLDDQTAARTQEWQKSSSSLVPISAPLPVPKRKPTVYPLPDMR